MAGQYHAGVVAGVELGAARVEEFADQLGASSMTLAEWGHATPVDGGGIRDFAAFWGKIAPHVQAFLRNTG